MEYFEVFWCENGKTYCKAFHNLDIECMKNFIRDLQKRLGVGCIVKGHT